jgi:hypothetical protein
MTTVVEDTLSAGYVGSYCARGGSASQQYDNVQVSDNFNSNVMSLNYDA